MNVLSPRVQRSSKEVVAIKVIDLESAEDDIEDIHQEISVLSQLSCTNITKYYGSFLKENKLWIVMEVCFVWVMGWGSIIVTLRMCSVLFIFFFFFFFKNKNLIIVPRWWFSNRIGMLLLFHYVFFALFLLFSFLNDS